MNYFDVVDHVSNSELTALKNKMNLIEERDLSAAYAFGTLFDAVITEEENVEALNANEQDLNKANLMKDAYNGDPGLRLILEKSQLQHEVYKSKFAIEWQGDEIEMRTKCKFDFLMKSAKLGADLKSTACTSESAFFQSIFRFGYDRQAAWYMDHAKLDKFMIIGVSKKANKRGIHQVWKFVIQRDDDVFKAAKRKYSVLAYHYYYLIYNLSL
jgi:hypothetical protein